LKKVCFVLGSHWHIAKGGSEYQAFVLIQQLKKMHPDEYKISYLCLGNKLNRHRWDGVDVYTIPKRRFLAKFGRPFVFDYLRIHKLLNQIKPDIIYQRVGLAFTGIIAHYARQNHCKTIWHIASEKTIEQRDYSFDAHLLNTIDKKILDWGIRRVDYVLGQAYYQNDMLKQNYNRECDMIIPNFHPVPKNTIQKQKFPKIVLWIGNFKYIKRPECFIDLAKKFSQNESVQFIMIGRPSSHHDWQSNLERKIDATPNLKYVGEQPISEVNKLLSKSWVLVNTSLTEGFSNTFIQSWMREVPVLSLNVDPDSVIQSEEIGLYSGTKRQLEIDLSLLLNDENSCLAMGKRAKKYAIENHSLKNVEKLDSFIENILFENQ